MWLGCSGDLLPGASWSSMVKPSTLTCEVMVDGAWRILGLDEAKVAHHDAVRAGPGRLATGSRVAR